MVKSNRNVSAPFLESITLFVVAIAVSPEAMTPRCPPRHAPHVGGVTEAPAFTKMETRPLSIASR